MSIIPPLQGPRLVALDGGRASEPPQTRWRFTPNGRCKESLWQALLSGVLYGAMPTHVLYRVATPSEEGRLQLEGFKRFQFGLGIFMTEAIFTLMALGIANMLRSGPVATDQIPAFLNPKRTVSDVFDNCFNREEISGQALLQAALKGKSNPLRTVKFEIVPWPAISEDNIIAIECHQAEQRQMMETGAILSAGGAVVQHAEGLSLSAFLMGAAATVFAPFFVSPPVHDDPSTRLL